MPDVAHRAARRSYPKHSYAPSNDPVFSEDALVGRYRHLDPGEALIEKLKDLLRNVEITVGVDDLLAGKNQVVTMGRRQLGYDIDDRAFEFLQSVVERLIEFSCARLDFPLNFGKLSLEFRRF